MHTISRDMSPVALVLQLYLLLETFVYYFEVGRQRRLLQRVDTMGNGLLLSTWLQHKAVLSEQLRSDDSLLVLVGEFREILSLHLVQESFSGIPKYCEVYVACVVSSNYFYEVLLANIYSFVAFRTLAVVDIDYIYFFVTSEASIVGEPRSIADFDDGTAQLLTNYCSLE